MSIQYSWDDESQQYRSAAGTSIPFERIESALNLALVKGEVRMRMLTESLQQGKSDLATWKLSMRNEIKYLHQVATATAHGGWANMGPRELGALGGRLQSQFYYLNRLSAQIASGAQPLNGRVLSRAGMYARAAYSTYTGAKQNQRIGWSRRRGRALLARRMLGAVQTEHCSGCQSEASRGWVPAEMLSPIGSQQCLTNCRCYAEYRAVTDEAYDRAFGTTDVTSIPAEDLQRVTKRVIDEHSKAKPLRRGTVKGAYDRNILKALADKGLIQRSTAGKDNQQVFYWYDGALTADSAAIESILNGTGLPGVMAPPKPPAPAPPPTTFGAPLPIGAKVPGDSGGLEVTVRKEGVPAPPASFATGAELVSYLNLLGVKTVQFPNGLSAMAAPGLRDDVLRNRNKSILEVIGPLMAKTLYEMAVLDLPMVPGVLFGAEKEFSSGMAANAAYDSNKQMLKVNVDAYQWSSLAELRRLTQADYQAGEQADPHLRRSMRHEFGHWLNHNHKRGLYEWTLLSARIPEDLLPAVQSEVHRYATSNGREFVAEMFSGLMYGKQYSSALMSLYQGWGGVLPPHIAQASVKPLARFGDPLPVGAVIPNSEGGLDVTVRKAGVPTPPASFTHPGDDLVAYLKALGVKSVQFPFNLVGSRNKLPEAGDDPLNRNQRILEVAAPILVRTLYEMAALDLPMVPNVLFGVAGDFANGTGTNASYLADDQTLKINLDAPQWASLATLRKQRLADSLLGEKSNPHIRGTVRHEFGHWLNDKFHPQTFRLIREKAVPASLMAPMQSEVSRYATANAREFIAEVFSGMMYGKQYSADLMAKYKEWGGIVPPHITVQARATLPTPLPAPTPEITTAKPGYKFEPFSGPFSTVDDAVNYLESQGTQVWRAGLPAPGPHRARALHALNQMAEVVWELKQLGIDTVPNYFTPSVKSLSGKKRGWIASHNSGNITAYIKRSEWWTAGLNPHTNTFKTGWHSSGHRLASLRHETGHFLHYKFAPDAYNSSAARLESASPRALTTAQKQLIINEVSRYGSTQPVEFVAEVFSGLMDGRIFPESIMALYKLWGGYLPDAARLKALREFQGVSVAPPAAASGGLLQQLTAVLKPSPTPLSGSKGFTALRAATPEKPVRFNELTARVQAKIPAMLKSGKLVEIISPTGEKAYHPPAADAVITIKKGADFAMDGHWDVTIKGVTYQIYRDTNANYWRLDESFLPAPEGKGWAEIGGRMFADILSTENRAEAITKLQEMIAQGKVLSTPRVAGLRDLRNSEAEALTSAINPTKEVLDTLQDYWIADPATLNSGLRSTNPQFNKQESKAIEVLDQLFSDALPLPHSSFLYRVVSDDSPIPEVGGTFTDKGYVSTSMTLAANRQVAEFNNPGGLSLIQLVIEVPAGRKVVPLHGKLNQIPEFEYQKEVLLPRGTAFQVISKTADKITLRVVDSPAPPTPPQPAPPVFTAISAPQVRSALTAAGVPAGKADKAGYTMRAGAVVEDKSTYIRITHIPKAGINRAAREIETFNKLNEYAALLKAKGFVVDFIADAPGTITHVRVYERKTAESIAPEANNADEAQDAASKGDKITPYIGRFNAPEDAADHLRSIGIATIKSFDRYNKNERLSALEALNQMSEVAWELKMLGLPLPKTFIPSPTKRGKNIVAGYEVPADRTEGTLYAFLKVGGGWWNPDTARFAQKEAKDTGWMASGHRLGTIRHEVGHFLQHMMTPHIATSSANLSARGLDSSQLPMIIRDVSRYATEKPAEFVAEVFSGLMEAHVYPDAVMNLYRRWGGVEPNSARLKELRAWQRANKSSTPKKATPVENVGKPASEAPAVPDVRKALRGFKPARRTDSFIESPGFRLKASPDHPDFIEVVHEVNEYQFNSDKAKQNAEISAEQAKYAEALRAKGFRVEMISEGRPRLRVYVGSGEGPAAAVGKGTPVPKAGKKTPAVTAGEPGSKGFTALRGATKATPIALSEITERVQAKVPSMVRSGKLIEVTLKSGEKAYYSATDEAADLASNFAADESFDEATDNRELDLQRILDELSPDTYELMSQYALGQLEGRLLVKAMLEESDFQAVLQERLQDSYPSGMVTIYRGGGGSAGEGSKYSNGTLSRTQAEIYASGFTGFKTGTLHVFQVPIEDVIGIGHEGEAEAFFRMSKGVQASTIDLSADEAQDAVEIAGFSEFEKFKADQFNARARIPAGITNEDPGSEEWANDIAEKWGPTSDESYAIEQHIRSSTDLNSYLRTGKARTTDSPAVVADLERRAAGMDLAFTRPYNVAPKDLIVYRALHDPALANSDSFSDKGFPSTAWRKTQQFGFGAIKIRIPKGFPALFASPHESEIILPRDLTFTKAADGIWDVSLSEAAVDRYRDLLENPDLRGAKVFGEPAFPVSEREVMSDYWNNGAERINRRLRNGNADQVEVQVIDGIYERAEKLRLPLTVFRGIQKLKKGETDAQLLKRLFGSSSIKTGDQFTELAYLSTTATKEKGVAIAADGVLMEFTVPKGMPVLSGRLDENELQFPRNLRYRITEVTHEGKRLLVKAELLLPPKDEAADAAPIKWYHGSPIGNLTSIEPGHESRDKSDIPRQDAIYLTTDPQYAKDRGLHLYEVDVDLANLIPDEDAVFEILSDPKDPLNAALRKEWIKFDGLNEGEGRDGSDWESSYERFMESADFSTVSAEVIDFVDHLVAFRPDLASKILAASSVAAYKGSAPAVKALIDEAPPDAIPSESRVVPATLTQEVESHPDYVYHATNAARLQDIADSGKLLTHKPDEFTDQDVWPDGATEKRSYFSKKAALTLDFAPQDGRPVIIRLKDTPALKRESTTGDIFSRKPIAAEQIEFLGNDQNWHPVLSLRDAGKDEAPDTTKRLHEEVAPEAGRSLERQFFNDRFTVTTESEVAEFAKRFFDAPVSDREWGRMIGAPDGAAVKVSVGRLAGRPTILSITATMPDAPRRLVMKRLIYKDMKGELVMENAAIQLADDLPAGFGTTIFQRQVEQAELLGVNYIKTEAAGSANDDQGLVGYYVWARLGYNAPLTEGIREALARRVQKDDPELATIIRTLKDLHQLMLLPGGKEAWKKHGTSQNMVFDLKKGSTSRRVLDAYVKLKGLMTLPDEAADRAAGKLGLTAVRNASVTAPVKRSELTTRVKAMAANLIAKGKWIEVKVDGEVAYYNAANAKGSAPRAVLPKRQAFQEFENRAPASQWANKTFIKPELTKAQIGSLRRYITTDYRAVNTHLREAGGIAKYRQLIGDLIAAVSRSEVPENVIAWRGMNLSRLSEQAAAKYLKPGSIIPDNGFISTSLAQKTAQKFLDGPVASRALLKIQVSAGTPGLFVDPFFYDPKGQPSDNEAELVLSHTTKLRIISIKKVRVGGHLISEITAELVSTVKAPAPVESQQQKIQPGRNQVEALAIAESLPAVAINKQVYGAVAKPVLNPLYNATKTFLPIEQLEALRTDRAFTKGIEQRLKRAKPVKIALADLIATQKHVSLPHLENFIAIAHRGDVGEQEPWAFRHEGKLYLMDGAHRAAAAYLSGKKSLNIRIIDYATTAAAPPKGESTTEPVKQRLLALKMENGKESESTTNAIYMIKGVAVFKTFEGLAFANEKDDDENMFSPNADLEHELAAQVVNEALNGLVNMPVSVMQGKGKKRVLVSEFKTGKQIALKDLNAAGQAAADKIALFDAIIGNTDRSKKNWMGAEVDNKGRYSQVIAIDHGLSFPRLYDRASDGILMKERLRRSPQLKPDEIAMLNAFKTRRAEVDAQLEPLIETKAVELMWGRVDAMLKAGKVLAVKELFVAPANDESDESNDLATVSLSIETAIEKLNNLPLEEERYHHFAGGGAEVSMGSVGFQTAGARGMAGPPAKDADKWRVMRLKPSDVHVFQPSVTVQGVRDKLEGKPSEYSKPGELPDVTKVDGEYHLFGGNHRAMAEVLLTGTFHAQVIERVSKNKWKAPESNTIELGPDESADKANAKPANADAIDRLAEALTYHRENPPPRLIGNNQIKAYAKKLGMRFGISERTIAEALTLMSGVDITPDESEDAAHSLPPVKLGKRFESIAAAEKGFADLGTALELYVNKSKGDWKTTLQVTHAIFDAFQKAGYRLPKEINVAGRGTSARKDGATLVASYQGDALLLNLDAPMFKHAAKLQSELPIRNREEAGWSVDGSVRGNILHELGHMLMETNAEKFGKYAGYAARAEGAKKLPAALRKQVRAEVSRYSAEKVGEFVAEVFSGLALGKTYAPEIMKAYKDYGGVLPNAKLIAELRRK